MSLILDLSTLHTERIFVIGEIRGEYASLINFLYDQNFTYKDTLVTTGNNINSELESSTEVINFLKNNSNTYSVKGKLEFNIINMEDQPNWADNTFINYIENLPLIIKVTDSIYIVNAGIEPRKQLEEQDPTVFYNIKGYDPDSRFYQFENPENKNWYDFEFFDGDILMKFCFGGNCLPNNEVTAGYSLGRDKNKALKCLIISKNTETTPIIIENL